MASNEQSTSAQVPQVVEKKLTCYQKMSIWFQDRERMTPQDLVKSQWQRQSTSVVYLIYRLICAAWCVEAFFSSFFLAKFPPLYWAIFYTLWSFTLLEIQMVLGLALVCVNFAGVFEPEKKFHHRLACQFYEWLHASSANQAFSVTLIYWIAVFNPRKGNPGVNDAQTHIVNSILIILDLLIVAFPVRIITFLLPLAISMVYLMFSIFYYISGGTNHRGDKFIYKIFNWDRDPRTAILILVASPFLIFSLHFGIWWISYGRRLLARRLGITDTPYPSDPPTLPKTEGSISNDPAKV